MENNTQGQAPEPIESPQVGNQEPASADAGQDSAKTFDEAYVKQLRAEAAKYRMEAKAMAEKVSSYEQERMTEAEKLQAQAKAAQEAAEAARAELRQAKLDAEVAKAAAELGIDLKIAKRFADPQWDGDKLNDIKANLTAALTEFPHLRPQPVAASATNPSRTRALTIDDIKKMSQDEINNRWDEVQATLAGG